VVLFAAKLYALNVYWKESHIMQAPFSPGFSCMGQTNILLNKVTLELHVKYSKVNGLGVLTHALELPWAPTV